jgi:hypothetical protein
MRNRAFLLLPLAPLCLAPRPASAQESFGAIVTAPEPRGPTPDTAAMRPRNPRLMAGGIILGSFGLLPLIGGTVFLRGLDSRTSRCSTERGPGSFGCALADLGTGIEEIGGYALVFGGVAMMIGGTAMAISGGSQVPARPPAIVPRVSVGPRAASLRWVF